MYIRKKYVNMKQNKESHLGFPVLTMNVPYTSFTIALSEPLCALNTYRHVMMSKLGVKKMVIAGFDTNDKFPI